MRNKQFVLLIGILAVTLLLTACAGVNLTLTFEVDGEPYETVTTSGQETVQMPKDPVKEGYLFDGWYWDKDVWEKPFTVNSLLDTPIKKNTTVYVKWKEHKAHAFVIRYDETNHWEECSVCGEKKGGEAHHFENEICTVCKKTYWTEGLTYNKIEGGYEVSGIGSAEAYTILIPSTYEGEPVIGIGSSSFANCRGLVSVEIPDSVTSIGDSAFYNCRSLISVKIPNSVTSIGSASFKYCRSIERIKIPNGVKSIDNDAFNNCGSLISVEIPNSVTDIGVGAFASCSSLETLTVAEGSAKFYSIDNCIIEAKTKTLITGCKNSILPFDGSVTSIGEQAFYGSKLVNIEIPDSVTNIGESAFSRCSGLESIKISNSLNFIGNGVFLGCSSLKSVKIPISVRSIDSDAFYGCSNLVSIIISDNVTYIGNNAFYGCSSLVSVVIPDNVTDIGNNAFYGCSSLVNVVIPDSVTSVGADAFSGTEIWNNTAENSVVYADKWAIGYKGEKSTVTNIALRADTAGIGPSAFSYCTSLVSLEIPKSVTRIGNQAFACSDAIETLTCPTIAIRQISKTNLKTVVLTSGNSIDSYAFSDCSSLISVKIPNDVTSIGEAAFRGCRNLSSIEIPSGVTQVGAQAFYDCVKLTSAVINNGVTSIGAEIFKSCVSLKSVTIPYSLTSIGEYAFYYCQALERIEYGGKRDEWRERIAKEKGWNWSTGNYTVKCSDGTLTYAES